MTRARISRESYRQWTHPEDPRKFGAQCDRCPLKGMEPVWGDGPRNPRFAFVGEAPGREEVTMSLPFVGNSGERLAHWLEKLHLARQEVWITNALNCFPEGGDLKAYLQRARKRLGAHFHSPVECCRGRLLRELKVPYCANCGKWMRGPTVELCVCPAPKWVKSRAGTMPEVTVPLGNFGMQAVLGVEGITAHRGYVEDMKKRRNALVGT